MPTFQAGSISLRSYLCTKPHWMSSGFKLSTGGPAGRRMKACRFLCRVSEVEAGMKKQKGALSKARPVSCEGCQPSFPDSSRRSVTATSWIV